MSLDDMKRDLQIKDLEDRIRTLEYHLNINQSAPVFPISLELDKLKGFSLMTQEVTVKFERTHPDAVIPDIAYEGDACFDLFAVEDTIIPPSLVTRSQIDLASAQQLLANGTPIEHTDGTESTVILVPKGLEKVQFMTQEEFLTEVPQLAKASAIFGQTVQVGKAFVPVGLKMELPMGWEATFRTRSGMGVKRNMRVHPGTIDAGYRGDLAVAVYNMSNQPELIKKGTAVAQVAIRPVPKVTIVEGTVELNSQRGEKGFGSSDKN